MPDISPNAFDGSYIEYATLHVPESAIEAYRKTTPWSGFKSIVSVTDTNNYYEMAVTVNNAHGTVVFGESSLTEGTQTYNVKEGTDVALTLAAEEGYKLASVTVDGVDKTADVVDGVLTISNVTADLTVDVKFSTAGTGLVLMGSEGTYEVPVKTSASVYAKGTAGRVGVLLQVHLESNLISCHFVVFFMVIEMYCDQLHRVAASRLLSLTFYIAKVQKILETTKHFLNFFRKNNTKGTVPFVYLIP